MEADNEYSAIWRLVTEIERLDLNQTADQIIFFRNSAVTVIRKLFGENSVYEGELNLLYSSYQEVLAPSIIMKPALWREFSNKIKNLLKTIEKEVDLQKAISGTKDNTLKPKHDPESNRVFVVHGQNEAMKQSIARVLETLRLEPVILHEQPNKGRTIIEKFTDNADVSFAVVLLSPDDIGYSKHDGAGKSKSRARQNVIFELGYFIGKIGREAVVALYPQDQDFEIPTDYSGVVFIPFDNSESWKYTLVKELQAFGFDVDANKLLRTK